MKHSMPIMKMAFDRIVNGRKKIEMRLWDEKRQELKLNDIIEFICTDTEEKVLCLVHGLAIFENFNDLIDNIPLELFGYDNKEEVKVRINRIYTYGEQLACHVVGIFIVPLQVSAVVHEDEGQYSSEGRSLGGETHASYTKYQAVSKINESEKLEKRQARGYLEKEKAFIEKGKIEELRCSKFTESKENER